MIESEDGRRYDRFRERVMFPIRNARGSLIGFGGRIIGKGEPKYLNSPETPLFSKGQELYGLWEARQAIRQEGQVIVVEGYMDVVGLAQQGIANAVATLGTATTPDHVKKLLRASDKVIFSFDGDGAGAARPGAPCRLACRCCAMTSRSASFSCRPSTIPIPMCANSAPRRSGLAWAKPSPCRDSCWTSWPRATTWMRPKGGRAVCTRPSRCWPRSRNALRVQIEREMAKLVQLTPEEMAQVLAQQPAAVWRAGGCRRSRQATSRPDLRGRIQASWMGL